MNLIVKALGYVLSLGFLEGYRTQLSGVAAILGGITLIALAAAGDPHGSVEQGVAAIIAGVAIVGAAGKSDKSLETAKAAAVLSMAVAPKDPTVSVGGIDKAAINDALAIVSPPSPGK